MSYRPVPGSHSKMAMCYTHAYMGHSANTGSILSYSPFLSVNWMLVGIPGLVNVIIIIIIVVILHIRVVTSILANNVIS